MVGNGPMHTPEEIAAMERFDRRTRLVWRILFAPFRLMLWLMDKAFGRNDGK
jgi:hypothetical protein